jgi:DNA ligase (NAD+)
LKEVGLNQELLWSDIRTLEGLGEKSVDKLLKEIEKSKNRPVARLIFGLGIRHAGEEMSNLLASHYNSIDPDDANSLANISQEELSSIRTIGPKIADSISAFFREAKNRDLLARLKKAGVRLAEKRTKAEAMPLAGQEFVITGRLESASRADAEARIKALGGTAKSDVTRQTSYLVVGADPGSKLARAREMGTKSLTEAEFLKLLDAAGKATH